MSRALWSTAALAYLPGMPLHCYCTTAPDECQGISKNFLFGGRALSRSCAALGGERCAGAGVSLISTPHPPQGGPCRRGTQLRVGHYEPPSAPADVGMRSARIGGRLRLTKCTFCAKTLRAVIVCAGASRGCTPRSRCARAHSPRLDAKRAFCIIIAATGCAPLAATSLLAGGGGCVVCSA